MPPLLEGSERGRTRSIYTGHRVTRGAGRARSAEKNTRGQGSGTRTQPEPQAEPSESTQIRDRAFVGGFIYRAGFFYSAAYTVIRTSLCSTPPRLTGIDLFKSPRSNPPLAEGRLDFLKGPRSKHPLQEARLDTRKVQGPTPPRGPQETLQKWSERARKGCFLRDLQMIFMRFPRGWRSVGLLKRSKVQLPPTGGSVGPHAKGSRSNPPL